MVSAHCHLDSSDAKSLFTPMTADGCCGEDKTRRRFALGAMLPRPPKTAINCDEIDDARSGGSCPNTEEGAGVVPD